MALSNLTVLAASFATIVVLVYLRKRSLEQALPPGPRPRFLVGNLHDLPDGDAPWLAYQEMSKTHGDIMYLHTLGKSILVLSSLRATAALLDKQGAVYSSRPRFPMINELLGWHWNVAFMPYGERCNAQRRVLQRALSPAAVAGGCHATIAAHARALVARLARAPDGFYHHLHDYTVATILRVTYGHTAAGADDELLQLARDTDVAQAEIGYAQFAVDLIPILKYVPAWVPGAGFQRFAQRWGAVAGRMRRRPYAMVKERLSAGTATACIATTLIEDTVLHSEDKEVVIDSIAVIYSAGSDTTAAALKTFILAMMLHPEVQRKAQEEIDRVTGGTRLPEFADRADLPYLECVLKETQRWRPVAPLGIPHATTQASTHNGWHIPRDTMVLTNIWAILHDPALYPDPARFCPERFLDGAAPDPARAAFGFGRRACPGRYFADAMLWAAAAAVLAALEVGPPAGGGGEVRSRPGLICSPEPFKCTIRPRAGAGALVGDAALEAAGSGM